MYNIWCEVKRTNVVLVIVGFIFSISSLFIDEKYDYAVIIVTILLCVYLLKSILKYLSLKKNGILIENVSYELDGNTLIVNYHVEDKKIKLFRKKENCGDIPSHGTTNILINPSNLKQYYIFDPKQ